MDKRKVKDFLAAVGEEEVQAALESECLPSVVTEISELVTTEGTSLLLGSIVGAAAPRINSIRLNYLEKRFEQRVETALSLMDSRICLIESKYEELEEELQEKFRSLYVEWFMDNLYVEKQPEKVQFHVNGYINMMDNSTNDNIMIMFMETLSELTMLDIDVLKLYSSNSDETAWNLIERYSLQPEQLSVIKEKLVRYGLVYSRMDDARDDNVDAIANYLIALDKEAKKKNPKPVKMKDIKKPKRTESYSITPLGRDFLNKITLDIPET